MAEYLSQYTGQQIDNILTSVDGKVSKNDVINDFAVNDALFPPSARLTYLLNQRMNTLEDTLTNKVIRTDGGEQTINGRKKFSSVIDANGGIMVPAQKTLTIIDEAINDTDGVNLSMLKKHGVSEDTAANGSGIKISLLPNGYNLISIDAANLTAFTTDDAPSFLVAQNASTTYKWPVTSLSRLIFEDSRFSNYVLVADYDQDMLSLETQINTINTTLAGKVNTSTYNTKMTALDSSISTLNTSVAGKVDTTTYNTKMTALDSAIAGKVDTSTYNTKMSALDSGIAAKVDTSTYNSKMTALDSAIAARTTIGKTNASAVTVAASGSAALPDFTQVNLTVIYVTATWGSLVDTYRVSMSRDGTLKTELLVQKSTAGTVSFAGSVVSGKLRLTITNANTATACSIDYNMIVSF